MILAAGMESILLAGITMVVLGVCFAIVLLAASIKFRVEVDPKIEAVHAALPNIDCGACGYAGCAAYAKAVVNNPEELGKCTPGGADTAAAVAEILNIQISGGGKTMRPIVHCRSHEDDKLHYSKYYGIRSCTAANAEANVQACKYGCLGFGDCVHACKFDALHVIDGLATVDFVKCTGCGACAKACPRYLIDMVPFAEKHIMTVACKSQESGKDTRAFCKVGCIACKICTKQSDIFSMNGNLAKVDYENYASSGENETAMAKCPTGVIVYRGKEAPADRPAGEKPKPAKAALKKEEA